MKKNMSISWDDEMDKILFAFKCQAKMSLKAIKTMVQRNGLSLSPEFKEYFLSVLNAQIKAAYEEIEAVSRMEDQLNSRADSAASLFRPTSNSDQAFHSILGKRRNSTRRTNDFIELVDSDDEVIVGRVHFKSETNTVDMDGSIGCSSSNRAKNMVNGFVQADLVSPSALTDLVNSTNNGVIDSSSIHNEGRGIDNKGQPNDTSVGVIDARSVIKTQPTDTLTVETLNEQSSGDQGSIIQIYDSDDEEMSNSLSGADGGVALEDGTNEVMPGVNRAEISLNQKKANDDESSIEVKDDIKPEREVIDDDIPLVLVEVRRVMNAPNGNVLNSSLNGSREPEHGILNGKATDEDCSGETSKQKSNVFPTERKSSKTTENVGEKGKAVVQKGPSNTKLKRFNCKHCDYASSRKGNFETHMRIHTGEKPYRCDRCFKRFSDHSCLNQHRKIHAKEFPFHCLRCFRGFLLENELTSHEMNCKVRRYECYLCEKFIIGNQYDLKTHMRTHTGEKPFRCEMCLMKFTQKSGLKRHLNTVHAKSNT